MPAQTAARRGFGPRPIRRDRRGDWMLLLFAIVLWGFISGSPLMRPQQSIAVDTKPQRPIDPPLPATSDVYPLPDVPYDLLHVNE